MGGLEGSSLIPCSVSRLSVGLEWVFRHHVRIHGGPYVLGVATVGYLCVSLSLFLDKETAWYLTLISES